MISLKNRQVKILSFDGIDHSDAPKYCDAYVLEAIWADTGEKLTDSELDQLDACALYDELWSYLH